MAVHVSPYPWVQPFILHPSFGLCIVQGEETESKC